MTEAAGRRTFDLQARLNFGCKKRTKKRERVSPTRVRTSICSERCASVIKLGHYCLLANGSLRRYLNYGVLSCIDRSCFDYLFFYVLMPSSMLINVVTLFVNFKRLYMFHLFEFMIYIYTIHKCQAASYRSYELWS